MLNRNILTRSADLAEDVREAMLVYVPNASFSRARDLLEDKRVCIISGLPGIGKTTLAQILTVAYAGTGYDIFEISEDAEEINAVWNDDAPQFFYYDDFLGQTVLDDRLHKNEDARLLRIIKRINRSDNKRMVLTTREYILEQARQRYERLSQEDFNPLTCVLALSDYTKLIRAEILYNHIYFSGLAQSDKAIFAQTETYSPIINHTNFNPRLIDYSVRLSIASGDTATQVPSVMMENLDHPRRIWEHIVLNQLGIESVQLLLLLFSLRQGVLMEELERMLERFQTRNGYQADHNSYMRSLKILENTMIRITPERAGSFVEYHNPSIRDYMREYIAQSGHILSDLLRSVIYFEQIETLWLQARAASQDAFRQYFFDARTDAQDAIIRTYDSASPTRSYVSGKMFRRAGAATEMAEKLELVDVAKMVASKLAAETVFDLHPDPYDIEPVIAQFWSSTVPEIVEVRPRILDEAIAWVMDDLSDWENARLAESVIGALGDLAPEAAYTTVEDSLFELAAGGIESAAEGYAPAGIDDMLDYADTFGDPADAFPGYSYVKSAADMSRRSAPRPSIGDKELADQVDNDDAIRRILGSLAAPEE
jgi:hypothetical protein